MDRPIKAINLVVLGLQEKGAARILSRNPLQLEVLDKTRATTNPERVLLDNLTPKGTMPRPAVQKVLEAREHVGKE